MLDLHGRVAVVTGAARGIGYAMANRLGREGMRVVIADCDGDTLARAEAALQSIGIEAVAVVTDVSRFEEVDRLPRTALATFGSIDVVCLNAGVNAAHVPTWDITIDDWEWILGPNVWGVIHGIHAFVPRMLAQATEGHIIITSSNGALRMRPSSGPYPTTKKFVLSLAESLHHDLATVDSKLQVSVLLPGAIRTGEAMARRGEPRVTRTDEQQQAENREMPPKQVAEILLQAIQGDRFYVLTHPERSYPQVQEWASCILEDRDPTPADRVL